MTTQTFSARDTLGAWSKIRSLRSRLGIGLATLAWITPLLAQSGTARLARGIDRFESGKYGEAIQDLKAAEAQAPKLADYSAFYLASSRAGLKDYAQVHADLAPLRSLSLASPLAAKAALLEAKALIETGSAAAGVSLLREHYDELPQPAGDCALAEGSAAAQDMPQAATYYNRVYHLYPLSDCATRAGAALEALRASMGSSYPAAAPQQRLERGNRLLAAHQYPKARAEFSALAPELSGAERDLAAVGIGAADYLDKKTAAACRYLQSLDIASAEAGAERLYYLTECARTMDDNGAMLAAIQKMAKEYPGSPWRLKALLSAGNRFLLSNQPESYEPLYRACYESFPTVAEASYCHWKVTWSAYLQRRKDAAELLREQIVRYPSSTNSSGALYFLGRLSENAKDFRAARGYYDKITERYPGYYYGILARERLAHADLVRATPAEPVTAFLIGVQFSDRSKPETYEPTAATLRRIERFQLLSDAGLGKLAEAELRFGAKTDGQPHLLAMELARTAGSPCQGLRNMKSLVSDYFTITPGTAPERFWELLFPLPFRSDVVQQSSASALDPNIVAGLVRQESEFNPTVISHAHAYGLTQLVPATGRQLARKAGVKRFSTNMLFQPSMNLRLGTTYLRSLLDQWGGKWEETLASYNAGKTHVMEWIKWADFQEPAEFVETIPFTETREYVQSVLRNAAAYKRIYGSRLTVAENAPPAHVQKVSQAKSSGRKSRRLKARAT
jgi:soluble lytic murein transglycosylase